MSRLDQPRIEMLLLKISVFRYVQRENSTMIEMKRPHVKSVHMGGIHRAVLRVALCARQDFSTMIWMLQPHAHQALEE